MNYLRRAGALDKAKKRLVWHVPSCRADTDVAQRDKKPINGNSTKNRAKEEIKTL